MEVAGFLETSVYLYQTKRYHISQDSVLQLPEFYLNGALNSMIVLIFMHGCYNINALCMYCVGLFSVIMRDQANLGGDNPKWIVLDGDIDPMWIESLNTVMDDNKVMC